MCYAAALLLLEISRQTQESFHFSQGNRRNVQEILGGTNSTLGRYFHRTPAFNAPPTERHAYQRSVTVLPADGRCLVG